MKFQHGYDLEQGCGTWQEDNHVVTDLHLALPEKTHPNVEKHISFRGGKKKSQFADAQKRPVSTWQLNSLKSLGNKCAPPPHTLPRLCVSPHR